jgi:SMP-30/gluconolaconase/LRE-like protein
MPDCFLRRLVPRQPEWARNRDDGKLYLTSRHRGILVYDPQTKPDNGVLAIGDCREGRVWYSTFITGPTTGCPQCSKDPLHLTFTGVKAGTYVPGNSCPDGIHYDIHGNLWSQLGGLGGIVEIDPRGLILGFVPIPNGNAATTNFAFGGPDNQYIYFQGAISGTFWRFKTPYPGLIGPGGVRLPAQP